MLTIEHIDKIEMLLNVICLQYQIIIIISWLTEIAVD